MLRNQPALAQIMFCLSHDEEIPDEVKEKALKQWGQYLLARVRKVQRLHFRFAITQNGSGFIKDDWSFISGSRLLFQSKKPRA